MNEEIKYKVGVDTSPFAKGMRSLKNIAKDVFSGMREKINSSFGAILSGGAILGLANHLGKLADEVKGASEAFGVSTDFIQGWRTAVSQNSGTVENANKAIERLSILMGQGSENFAKWGISLTDVNGNAKTTEQIIGEIADKMKNTASGTERAAMAFDLLGKSGTALIPTLIMGREELTKYIAEVDKLSAGNIQDLANAQDTLNRVLDGFVIRAAKVIEYLVQLHRTFVEAKKGFGEIKGEGNFGALVRAFGNVGSKPPAAPDPQPPSRASAPKTAEEVISSKATSEIKAKADELTKAMDARNRAITDAYRARGDKEHLESLEMEIKHVTQLHKLQKDGTISQIKLETQLIKLGEERERILRRIADNQQASSQQQGDMTPEQKRLEPNKMSDQDKRDVQWRDWLKSRGNVSGAQHYQNKLSARVDAEDAEKSVTGGLEGMGKSEMESLRTAGQPQMGGESSQLQAIHEALKSIQQTISSATIPGDKIAVNSMSANRINEG